MSTKATIVYTSDANIYEETAQSQYWGGRFLGNDIIVIIDKKSIKNLKITNLNICIDLFADCELAKAIGENISIFGGNVIDFEIDEEDLMIEIKGGSFTAEQILKKVFI